MSGFRCAGVIGGMWSYAALAAVTVLIAAPAAVAAPTAAPTPPRVPDWAPRAKATILPGVQMYTRGGQCTGNFVFTDSSGGIYVGYAAHCAATGDSSQINGCRAATRPEGTKVTFRKGGSVLGPGRRIGTGRLAYSSWVSMQRRDEQRRAVCMYNDFALVKVTGKTKRRVNPTVPFFGGPNGLSRLVPRSGTPLYSVGNSALRGGVEVLRPKLGFSLGRSGGSGWSQTGYTVTPGVPGDSGSGYLDAQGNAHGVLSTLAFAPLPASNGIGDLRRELRYARQHSGIDGLRLAKGEVAFSPLS